MSLCEVILIAVRGGGTQQAPKIWLLFTSPHRKPLNLFFGFVNGRLYVLWHEESVSDIIFAFSWQVVILQVKAR